MSYNHGGYDNDDERPQKEILFRAETMRQILGDAARTGSHDIGPELMASISSHTNSSGYAPQSSYRTSPPRSSASRNNSYSAHTPPHDNSQLPGRTTYRDSNGDLVQRWDGDEEPELRVHNYDPEWNEKPKGPSRSNTGNNSGISVHRNSQGDYVQQHDGHRSLAMRTHSQHSPPPSSDGPPVYQTRDREGNLVQHYDGEEGGLTIRTHGPEDYSGRH
ncbi:hypothetical protein L873DRAFT_1679976 [Choiromyces venosus 120613-1]|uniref:Uncharacterized protein n=1 Tax=Choiromyces venosus 120613-1 TaxID=1336337 RepID=A0A3N4JWL2_9PEZI|nr:hypothetical protein L873DRAFT_1679976 [Choiromyces venosus 120613-1]